MLCSDVQFIPDQKIDLLTSARNVDLHRRSARLQAPAVGRLSLNYWSSYIVFSFTKSRHRTKYLYAKRSTTENLSTLPSLAVNRALLLPTYVRYTHFRRTSRELSRMEVSINILSANARERRNARIKSGFGSRGDRNIFKNNEIWDNKGAGIRLGGHNKHGEQYGVGNHVIRNKLWNNDYLGLKVQV